MSRNNNANKLRNELLGNINKDNRLFFAYCLVCNRGCENCKIGKERMSLTIRRIEIRKQLGGRFRG